MQLLKTMTLFAGALLLTGCAYITQSTGLQSNDKQYLNAKSIPPLKMPPGISPTAFESYYPVSDREYPEAEKTVSLIPPGLTTES